MPAKAKQAAVDPYALTAWAEPTTNVIEDVTMPSGQLAQVMRPGVEGLIDAGILNEVDGLSGIVSAEFLASKTVGQDGNIAKDAKEMLKALEVADKVALLCILQPKLHPKPEDGVSREPGRAYIDQISSEDKMFVFQYVVGGTRDIETFRAQSAAAVGNVQNGKAVPGATVGRARAPRKPKAV